MARSRLCRVCKEFHSFEEAWPDACLGHFAPRGEQATYVRADGMDPIKSQLDGKVYDSKSGYYGSLRRANCEIVGNDKAGFGPRPEYRPQGVAQDIKRALESYR